MRAYIIRRLLLMIPTFVGISLLLFVVLNLAPGRPGKQAGDVAADASKEGTQESHRIFREQFNLDKPVLFNTLFTLQKADIDRAVRVALGADHVTPRERIQAQQNLEDYGAFAVPHLVLLIRDYDAKQELQLRDTAVYFLRLAARQPLIDPFEPHPAPEIREQNARIDRENSGIRELRYAFDAPETDKHRVIEAWYQWFDARASRFQYSAGEKLSIFFLETRFARYWSNLLRLDFGVSLVSREPVMATLVSKLKYSLSLSVVSLTLAYLLAIPLGVFSAVKRDTPAERSVTVGLFMLYSLPSFFVATLLLIFLSEGSDIPWLRWFPTGGFQSREFADLTVFGKLTDVLWHLVLPIACLTYGSLAALSRYMRSGLLEVLQADYVRTARAKGLPESTVVVKHALRNGLLPILTLLAGLLPAVLGGSVIIEYIFGIPGMGLWTIDSIYQRDYNVIMAVELLTTVLVLVGILLTDLSYAIVDPRIRYS
ncbi:MAG TPA: ABC transporter permease subunit [Polyangiaceae bacterium]|nr:ABC transporter permease subunit [Polyangiaceae bacterium]